MVRHTTWPGPAFGIGSAAAAEMPVGGAAAGRGFRITLRFVASVMVAPGRGLAARTPARFEVPGAGADGDCTADDEACDDERPEPLLTGPHVLGARVFRIDGLCAALRV